MDIKPLTEQKQSPEEKFDGGGHRYLIADFKRALRRGRLCSIKSAVQHLHNNPSNIPFVVARLNSSIGHSDLKFRWFPGNHNESGKLLIRNQSIGLLVKLAPNAAPVGMMIAPTATAPFSSVTPESALSLLSEQVRRRNAMSKVSRRSHASNNHLQLLSPS